MLGLTFGLAVTIGNTIGAGILRTPGDIAGLLPSAAGFIGIWVVGGLYALLGANALAELGTMMPRSGAQYVFAHDIFGDYVGFVVGWMDWISTCASIAGISIVIGESAVALAGLSAGAASDRDGGRRRVHTVVAEQHQARRPHSAGNELRQSDRAPRAGRRVLRLRQPRSRPRGRAIAERRIGRRGGRNGLRGVSSRRPVGDLCVRWVERAVVLLGRIERPRATDPTRHVLRARRSGRHLSPSQPRLPLRRAVARARRIEAGCRHRGERDIRRERRTHRAAAGHRVFAERRECECPDGRRACCTR